MARRKPKSRPSPSTRKRVNNRQGILVSLAIIAVAVVGVYWSSFGGQFVLDDNASIVENPHIRSDRPLLSSLMPPDQAVDAPRWRGPVVALSLAVNHSLGGLHPRGYHVLNVLAHLLVALTLFGIVRRTLLLKGVGEQLRSSSAGIALSAALLWAVHPLLTDSVTYVVQRTTVIMGLFYLGCFYLVVRGATARRSRHWYAGAIVCCLLGMLTKEAMITAPFLVLVYDRIFLSGSWGELRRRRGWLHLGLAATWTGLIWLMVVSPHPGNVGLDLRIGPFGYLMAQTQVITHYLLLVVWPSGLLLDYGPTVPVSPAAAALPGLFLLALLAVTVAGLKERPRIAFLGVWFFITLAPTSSVVPIVEEVGAERRMYLPLMALILLAVLGGQHLLTALVSRKALSSKGADRIGKIVVAVLACALGSATVMRNHEYHDLLGLWRDTVAKRPTNHRAFNGLGVALARSGENEEAIQQYKLALQLNPTSVEALFNLGRALSRAGRSAESIPHYEKVIRLQPDHFKALNNLGNIYLQLGRYEEAEVCFAEVLRLEPESPYGHNGMGLVLAQQGHGEEALGHFRRALHHKPNYANAAFNMGRVLAGQGRNDEAITEFRRALRIEPGHTLAKRQLEALLEQ